MNDHQFDKLFTYIEEFRGEINLKIDRLDKRTDDVYNLVDGLAGLIKDYHQELHMLSRQVDRLRAAITQIAKETGVNLEIEL